MCSIDDVSIVLIQRPSPMRLTLCVIDVRWTVQNDVNALAGSYYADVNVEHCCLVKCCFRLTMVL